MGWVCLLFASGASIFWVAITLAHLRMRSALVAIDDVPFCAPKTWPKLSVIVAAKDEAHTIEAACRSLLMQSYPDLEVVLVNDRSTDETGARMNAIAASDPRVRVVHITELPKDWLGKVHALQQGYLHSGGEWVLFTDADVHFRTDALRVAVASAIALDVDHLAIMPAVLARSLGLVATLLVFGETFFLTFRPDRHADSRAQYAIGVGAFNLVRRVAMERTPGFSWLKMEVADDVGLATMIKRFGGKTRFFMGIRLLFIEWYPSVRALIHGLEKNMFGAVAGYSVLKMFVTLAIIALATAGPFIGLLAGGVGTILGVLAILLAMGIYADVARGGGYPAWAAAFAPVGAIVLMIALTRSTVMAMKHRGVRWRATFYPIEDLRRGRRIG